MPKKTKIDRLVLIRLPRLFNMLYKPSELAAELRCPVRTIYHYVGIGCPHTRDEAGHVWINGREFRRWAEAYNNTNRQPLDDGKAYCMHCNRAQAVIGPITIRTVRRGIEMVSGTCAECGARVNRTRASERMAQEEEST